MTVGMNHFSIFIAVAENKSFIKTSKQLWVTQPTVSYHISKLEKYFGVKLLQRDYKRDSVELTLEGEIIYDLLKPFVDQVNTLHNQWQSRQDVIKTIKIGATYTPATYILPKLIPTLIKNKSDVHVSFYADNSENIIYDLIEKKTDIGIITLHHNKEIPYKELETIAGRRETIKIVVNPGNIILKNKNLTKKDLVDFPLIFPHFTSPAGYSLKMQLAENKFELNHLFEVDSVEMAKKSIIEGGYDGGAFVPEVTVKKELQLKKLVVLDLPDINFFIDYAIVINKKNNTLLDNNQCVDSLVCNFNNID